MKNYLFDVRLPMVLLGATLFLGSCSKEKTTETTSTTTTEDTMGHDMDMDSAKAGSNEIMDKMHDHMEDMRKVKLTGDPDNDFALIMAEHHKGGIEMAEEEVDNGTDTMLVNMAKRSITLQKDEREKLEDFADDHKPASRDTSMTMKFMQPMKDMMGKMDHSKTGTTDFHFATLMSMHHQNGMDLVDAYLKQAKVPAMKTMAQKIKDEQQKEKKMLDNWLAKQPK
jgi:uncharacterized protein (DUF305 family)